MSHYRFAIPAPGDTDPYDHFQRWLAHVEAGRIGGRVASVANPSPNGEGSYVANRCGCATPSASPEGEGTIGKAEARA